VSGVVAGGALVELVEVDGVLEGAVLDEGALGDVGVVLGQAHDEAEVDLGVGIQLAGAELNDVADALRGAVLAVDAAVGSGPGSVSAWVCIHGWAFRCNIRVRGVDILADVGELKVDLVVDLLHGGQDQGAKSVLDWRLDWNTNRG
jgi:hypothetical protein